ncbi:rhomboid family intramembrane serine protease [Oryzobacter terrae]|uniref:rhomboid family intramembrane serine protease n=1 Tax=Oryzobacter terrae TaxID=1620385 RepID=UPI0036716DE1
MTEQPATPDAVEQIPVCPRHPDRESYVRCQRCRRPTCPECQRPAAVGIQCVDCVAEGRKSVRQARTVFGGTVTDGRPVVTMSIIGICVAVFLAQMVLPNLTSDVAFVPALGTSEPWRFLTSAFAHSQSLFLHIAFNMYALWVMGTYLEPLVGRARFAATYLLSALGGSVVYLLLAPPQSYADALAVGPTAWWTPAVGASGAVFGLFGAFLVLQRRLGRSAAGMYVVIGVNAVIGFVIPGIAWQAHLGGLLTGAACAAAVGYLGRARSLVDRGSPRLHWAGLAGVLVVLVVLTAVKYALAPA